LETSSPDSSSPQSQVSPVLEAYRIALLLTGRPLAAASRVRDAFASLAGAPSSVKNEESRRAWVLRQLSRQAREGDSAQHSVEPLEPWARVASLPEPGRSAFAFFQGAGGSLNEVAKILDLTGEEGLAEPLAQARQALAPEQYFPIEPLLQLHRSWGGDSAEVARAVAGVDEKTGPQLAAQSAFDAEWHKPVESMILPAGEGLEELRLQEPEEDAPTGLRAILRQPAVLAIGVALLVMFGVGIFAAMQRMDGFPGKELIADLIEDGETSAETKLEGIDSTEAGQLSDWFLLKGFENFSVPSGFEKMKAIGCRVFKFEGYTVAQIALEPRNALLFVFRPSEGDLRLESSGWQVYQQDDWAVAVRKEGENCYVVSFMGDSDDMPEFLRSAGK